MTRTKKKRWQQTPTGVSTHAKIIIQRAKHTTTAGLCRKKEINIRDVEGVPQSKRPINSTYLRSTRKCMWWSQSGFPQSYNTALYSQWRQRDENFVKTNRGTDKPCCQVNEYSGTAGSRSPARWLSQCLLLPGAGRRETLTLDGLHSFRVPSFIQGWPQNYIASPWTQYSFWRHPGRWRHNTMMSRQYGRRAIFVSKMATWLI